jgi:hypothetical protein
MYVVFADLGKARDYAVQGIIQHDIKGDDPKTSVDMFVLRYLKRFPLGTSYHDQVDHYCKLMDLPDLHGDVEGVYDATGVGKAVAELFGRKNVYPTGLTITSGSAIGANAEGYTVPKVDLVDGFLISLETGRFVVAQGVDEAAAAQLKREMIDLKIRVNPRTKHVGIEAGHEDVHDDIVMGVCMGLWWIKRRSNLIEGIDTVENPEIPYDELTYGLK